MNAASTASALQVLPLENWEFRRTGDAIWAPATTPGCVHTDLLAAGSIDDPFFRDNEENLQWIGETGWEYRCLVDLVEETISGEGLELVFEGLDTFASVYVNGSLVLSADNMFRTWRIPISGVLETGSNEILVRFDSAIERGKQILETKEIALPAMNEHQEPRTSPYIRKAPYHFGWDWGPRFVTCGIWRPAYLRSWSRTVIRDVQIVQKTIDSSEAKLEIVIDYESQTEAPCEISVAIPHTEFESRIRHTPTTPGAQTATVPLTVSNPRLWWPNGHGDPYLYYIVVQIRHKNTVLDSRLSKVGLRTVSLVQTKGSSGSSFTFVVNGRTIFCKGANWIPADSFPSRLGEAEYRQLLTSAAEAGMNMLRVWGGGIYEDDIFYEICDELGLLIWQDFMFSCTMYPADDAFLESVRAEAEDNIRRLRNHPSIALWCGNNEMEWGWEVWGWRDEFPESVWCDYEAIFHDLLPNICASLDPTRPYWPSSPSSDGVSDANSETKGDMHYWGVWHEELPFKTYREQSPRFMSEYGFQSFPLMKTVAGYALPQDFDIESPVMQLHQKHPNGNHLIRTYMERTYPEPKTFEAFLYLSQVQQADGIRIGTEHLRRLKPYCAGALYWQLNDCWPVASWSSIDYHGRWKALHYAAKRFFADLLLTVFGTEDGLCFGIVSDLAEDRHCDVKIELKHLSGESRWTRRIPQTLPADTSQHEVCIPLPEVLQHWDCETHYLKGDLLLDGEIVSTCRHFFVPPKEFRLESPTIAITSGVRKTSLDLHISTNTLARFVHLDYPNTDGHFSDNFFDLDAGETKVVTFKPKTGALPSNPVIDLQVMTLVDAF